MLGHYVIGKRRKDDKPDDGDAFGCCCGWVIGGVLLLAAGYRRREVQASAPIDDTQARIEALKAELQATDYIALKAIEGYDCDALYPQWKARRRALRDEINELESEA